MQVIDSHCHAWRCWPYDAAVPDPRQRGSIEALLYEMDVHGVERAAVICARIGHEVGPAFGNDDNNDYVAAAVAERPDRLVQFPDVDCVWRPEHHTPGAAGRLQQAVDRYGPPGFTHYVGPADDGWFASEEGVAFFETADDLGLLVSLAAGPAWQPAIRALAERLPGLRILLHHQAGVRLGPGLATELEAVLANADLPNLYIKASGFHYLTEPSWDYPYARAREQILRPLVEAYGADRVAWGSDFPAARWHLTYTQSVEAFRACSSWMSEPEMGMLFGGTMAALLTGAAADPVRRGRRPRS